MPIYPLGTIMEVVESVSAGPTPMKVSYAYEDLVFMEHNAFLLQFTTDGDEVILHKNISAEMDEIEEPIAALKTAAAEKGIAMSEGSLYSLEQSDGEKVTIKFIQKELDG